MLIKYLILLYTHLRWVLDFLLYYPFYKLHDVPIIGDQEMSICHYEGSEEDVDCAVCLCKIEEGEEIRVLRCEHMFHRNCLNRWESGFKNYATCPLCREAVGPRKVISELGAQVLLFEFCNSIRTDDDRHTWWLR
ncbi:Zinc finger, RING-type [Sesbania bispinosa]|nr:Zinc finger, RING-type [Sesbania bispinosa]